MEGFKLETGRDENMRQAYRTRVPGFDVKFLSDGKLFQVKDLSASGFAVHDESGRFPEGSWHEVEFYLNKKLFLSSVNTVVIRVVGNGIVGFNFEGLERRQVIKLDKLVLEVQKRLIKLRKAKAEE